MKKLISFGFAALLAVSLFADVVALRNVAVVTAVGSAPNLPSTAAGLNADGTVSGEYSVVWDSAEAPASEGITTVNGMATVNDATMSVVASVRAKAASLANHSPSATPTVTTTGQMFRNYKDAIANTEVPTATQWNDYIVMANGAEAEITIGMEWTLSVTISKVTVYFTNDGNYQYPGEDLKFYKVNGDDLTAIDFTAGASVDVGTNKDNYREYTFASPQTLNKLKFVARPNNGKYLFIRRFWAFGPDASSVVPSSADTLTALEVDDETVQLQDDVYTYEVTDGEAITKAENDTDNVAVTILPKYDYKAYAVTLAEDGESTKTYTVSMPKSHDHVFGEWQVITPATVYAPGLRRRVCTYSGCEVYEEEEIPQIPRKTVKWVDVDFANYTDGSTIADGQVDPVDGGTWAKPSDDDTATVAHGDVNLAALVVTNDYLCYAAKAQTSAGRDATVEFKAKFQKPTTDVLPQALDLGQTAVFVFPDGKGSCYKAYTSAGWVKLTGATPDFEKFVTIKIEVRYEYGERLAKVSIDGAECTPDGAESPWFPLAGAATKLTSVNFFGEFGLGNFSGNCLSPVGKGVIILFR